MTTLEQLEDLIIPLTDEEIETYGLIPLEGGICGKQQLPMNENLSIEQTDEIPF